MKAGKSVESLQQIFDTAVTALPQVLHIAVLILLIIFIFAVAGMNILGRVALQGDYDMKQQGYHTQSLYKTHCSIS